MFKKVRYLEEKQRYNSLKLYLTLGVPGVTEEPFGEVVPDKPFKPELLPRKLFGISGGQCGPKGC